MNPKAFIIREVDARGPALLFRAGFIFPCADDLATRFPCAHLAERAALIAKRPLHPQPATLNPFVIVPEPSVPFLKLPEPSPKTLRKYRTLPAWKPRK